MLVHQPERIFVNGQRHRLQEVIRRHLGDLSADDDTIGIQQIDESGQLVTQLAADLRDEFDAQRILLLGGGDDVGDRNNVAAPDLARKDRRLVVMDTLDELAADGAARKFGLDAILLS